MTARSFVGSLLSAALALVAISATGCAAAFRRDTAGYPSLGPVSTRPTAVAVEVRVEADGTSLETDEWEDIVRRTYRESGLFSLGSSGRSSDTWTARVQISARSGDWSTPALTLFTAFVIPSRERTQISVLTSLVDPAGNELPIIRGEGNMDVWIGWLLLPVTLVTLRTEEDVARNILGDLIQRSLVEIRERLAAKPTTSAARRPLP